MRCAPRRNRFRRHHTGDATAGAACAAIVAPATAAGREQQRCQPGSRNKAGVELSLPRPSWNITASGPPGVNQIVVMVSRSPRDLSGTGIPLGRRDSRIRSAGRGAKVGTLRKWRCELFCRRGGVSCGGRQVRLCARIWSANGRGGRASVSWHRRADWSFRCHASRDCEGTSLCGLQCFE